MTTPMHEFARLLDKLGSQQKLADHLGISKQCVNNIARGRRAIGIDIAEKLGFELVWRKKR